MSDSADERLVVMLEARISEFEKRMQAAERRGTRTYNGLARGSSRATKQMEADMIAASARINQALASVHTQIGSFAKAFAGGLAVGALNGLVGAAQAAIGEMADLADIADRVGIDVESYQGLEQGLKLAGVNADEAAGAMQAFAARLGDAAANGGALADLMKKSGVAITDSTGAMRGTLDILRDYADVVKNSPDAAEKMALVTEAFGKGGKAMVLAMSEGRAGIDGMIEEARAAGTVIDEDMIRKAAELDDKFDKVRQTLGAMFKEGVISAAEFFGMFDRLDDIIPQDAAANILGPDLAAALAENSTALEKSKADLAELAGLYDQLQQRVTFAADTISNEIPYLLELGQNDLALELSDITGQMGLLVAQVKDGKIPATQLDAEMQKLIDRAAVALETANKIDGVNLGGAVAAVDSVSTALASAVDWAKDLLFSMGKIAGVGIGASDGSGDAGAGASASGSGKMNLKPSGKKPGASSSGGGNSGGRLAALLADLQTEREAVTAWYTESLELLNGATKAQLEAVGGRHAALERLEAEHQERLRGIRDESDTGALANAETFFGALASVTGAGNSRMIAASRKFAAAEAMINVLRAQAQVLADQRLGFWAKLPAMAAIGAAGMSLVTALGGSGSAGGGSAKASSGAAGGSGAAAAAPADPLLVTMKGLDPKAIYSGQAIIDLATALQKEFGKRGLQLGFVQ